VVMDWFSRYVIAWELSTTLDFGFLRTLPGTGVGDGQARDFQHRSSVQYTSEDFTRTLLAADVRISMNGAGRCFDNIMVERLWRSVKQEEVYLKEYEDVLDCRGNLAEYFAYYNGRRRHSIGTPGPPKFTTRRIERKTNFSGGALGLCPRPRDFFKA